MVYKNRAFAEKLLALAGHFPVVVIVGARQVGKTTLLKHAFAQNAEYVVFDPVQDVENARQDPDLFLNSHATPIILDEIQYAPEVVSAIKRRVDADRRPGQYFLTGSQQWGVLTNIAESLSGRAAILQLDGFSVAESAGETAAPGWLERYLDAAGELPAAGLEPMHTPFRLVEHMFRGGLPEAHALPLGLIRDFHQSYILTYIERDVRLLADISDYQLFGRFFRLMGAYSAQEINYSQMGRELGISNTTAGRWLDVLRASFQWTELPAYSGNAVKRISMRPKGYMADTGLLCTGQYVSNPQALPAHPLWGGIMETFAVTELLKRIRTMDNGPAVYHWRVHNGAEIDVLLERDGMFFPIEVKASTRVARKDTRGITAFRKTYPHLNIRQGIILYPGDAVFRLNENDWAVPVTLA